MSGINIAAFGFLGAVVVALAVGVLGYGVYLAGRAVARRTRDGAVRVGRWCGATVGAMAAAGVFDVLVRVVDGGRA